MTASACRPVRSATAACSASSAAVGFPQCGERGVQPLAFLAAAVPFQGFQEGLAGRFQ